MRIYQGGTRTLQTVKVEAMLTDGRGGYQQVRADQFAPAQFSAHREADYTVDLPLATLTPGPYLLTVRAAAGERTAVRHIRFAMQ